MISSKWCGVFLAVVVLVALVAGCAPQAASTTPPTTTAPAKVDQIKIGICRIASGAWASNPPWDDGAEFVFDEVNKSGGIKSMGGAKIVVVKGDNASDPAKMVPELERLYYEEKVDSFIQGTTGALNLAATSVVDKMGVPFMATVGPADQIWPMNLHCWFSMCKAAQAYGDDMIIAFKGLVDEYKIKTDRIAIVTPEAPTNMGSRDGVLAGLKEMGLTDKVVSDIKHPATMDLESMVSVATQIKASNPDVLFCTESSATLATWLRAAQQINFHAPIQINQTTTLSTEAGRKSVGDVLMDDQAMNKPVFMESPIHQKSSWPQFQAFNKKYQAWLDAKKMALHDYNYYTAVTAYALVEAYEKAGTKDPKVITDTLHKLRMTSDDPWLIVPFVGGSLSWDAQGKPTSFIYLTCQWQNNQVEIVYPKDQRTNPNVIVK